MTEYSTFSLCHCREVKISKGNFTSHCFTVGVVNFEVKYLYLAEHTKDSYIYNADTTRKE